MAMRIVTSSEFRDNQKKCFDMADNNEQVVVKRRNKAYKLVPVSDDDMVVEIPKEYRQDPYKISPGGDMFWADERNVEKVKKAIEKKGDIKVELKTPEDIKKFLNNI
jgi:hypothetical protein